MRNIFPLVFCILFLFSDTQTQFSRWNFDAWAGETSQYFSLTFVTTFIFHKYIDFVCTCLLKKE